MLLLPYSPLPTFLLLAPPFVFPGSAPDAVLHDCINITVSFIQNCDTEAIEKVAYTSRQLNSASTSLKFFTLVVICQVKQLDHVKSGVLKCFDSTEVAYAYDKSAQPGMCNCHYNYYGIHLYL